MKTTANRSRKGGENNKPVRLHGGQEEIKP